MSRNQSGFSRIANCQDSGASCLEEKESTSRRGAENKVPWSHSLRLFASARDSHLGFLRRKSPVLNRRAQPDTPPPGRLCDGPTPSCSRQRSRAGAEQATGEQRDECFSHVGDSPFGVGISASPKSQNNVRLAACLAEYGFRVAATRRGVIFGQRIPSHFKTLGSRYSFFVSRSSSTITP